MTRIIYDCTLLVNASISKDLHRTGLYRVSHEILIRLSRNPGYRVLLIDNLFREREVDRHLASEYPDCSQARLYSPLVRSMFFAMADWADRIRDKEKQEPDGRRRILRKVVKNLLLISDKTARKAERKLFFKGRLRKLARSADIYYSSYFPLPEFLGENPALKRIHTVHDLIPILHPEFFSSPYNRALLEKVVEEIAPDDCVFCVSASTRNDLLKMRPDLKEERVLVVPNAASDWFSPVQDTERIEETKRDLGIPSGTPYILSLCTLEPRKNLQTVLRSFELMLRSGHAPGLKLVLAGAPGWDTEGLTDRIDGLNREFGPCIYITGYVRDDQLAPLYSAALCFVYPSLYEGFGLPVLEAMHCGTPVICSNTSSLPEVIEDAGISIKPTDHEGLASAILKLRDESETRRSYGEKALKQASKFSWEAALEIIESEIAILSS